MFLVINSLSFPDNMEIPSPLVRREFSGGLYATHVLRAWDFQDWRRLKEWVNASDRYDNDWGSPRWEAAETGYSRANISVIAVRNCITPEKIKDIGFKEKMKTTVSG